MPGKLAITFELDRLEASSLRAFLARTLSRDIKRVLDGLPAKEIAAADRARDALSLALYLALQQQEAPDAS